MLFHNKILYNKMWYMYKNTKYYVTFRITYAEK